MNYRTHATITRFWLETALEYQPYIHKARILWYKPLEKTFFDFKRWVKNIQTAGYNGARTVNGIISEVQLWKKISFLVLTSGKFLEALRRGIGTGSIFCLSFSLSNRVLCKQIAIVQSFFFFLDGFYIISLTTAKRWNLKKWEIGTLSLMW